MEDYGVGLSFTPTVLNNGIINLQLDSAVSELDTAHAILVNGTLIPGIINREVHTSVELRNGQSCHRRLLQAQSNNDISQLPWLGKLPVLGALFRWTNYQKQETDLVVIVSPHLVTPVRPGQQLATPFDTTLSANDIDLFLMGDTERQKRYTDFVASGGGLNGPTAISFKRSDAMRTLRDGLNERKGRGITRSGQRCSLGLGRRARRLFARRAVRRSLGRLYAAFIDHLANQRQCAGGESGDPDPEHHGRKVQYTSIPVNGRRW